MENNLIVKPVEFLGDTLMAAQDADGNIWAGVRWICDGIGLTQGQMQNERSKLRKDEVLSKGERNFVLPTEGGEQEVLCIALEFIPLWLAKISITPTMRAENPDVADKLVQYQLKAKDVLAAAFLPTEAQRPLSQAELILQQAQFMVDMERRQNEQDQAIQHVNKRLDDACELIALDPTSWRKQSANIIRKIAQKWGGAEHIKDVYEEVYKLVDLRAASNLKRRLDNRRAQMAERGACKSKRDSVNKLDIIGDDKKLLEVFLRVVSQMAVKYGVGIDAEWKAN